MRQGGGEEQLSDELLGTIAEALRPGRRGGHGPVWNLLVDQRSFVEKLLDDDLTLTKIHTPAHLNWCLKDAGERIHGTTQRRPVEVFRLEELPQLLAAPTSVYDLPIYAAPKVHRDRHVEVAKALYSIPDTENLVGLYIQARVDRQLARFFYKGRLVKVHPRQPAGGRSTDPADLPDEKRTYAMRDLEYLRQVAAGHGEMVGVYAARLLESPLPRTKMRQVYRLLGLVRRYGPERVEQACSRALEAEVLSVTTLSRMLERALEAAGEKPPPTGSGGKVIQLRFARNSDEFAVTARRTDRD